jgi:dCTP deaminase
MTVLSAQSIWRLCLGDQPMISPFAERGVANGRSFGLSACTYDCRIAQRVVLDVGKFERASTIERFCLPDNVCGSVLDKSSFARIGVSALNTHLDPGWEGWLTLELVNLSGWEVVIDAGEPICQVKFEWLDEATELPYAGKYQNQENGPVAARYEGPE